MADVNARENLARAEAELELRAAQIVGLERMIGQAEQLGRRSAAGLASLMSALGNTISPEDVLPSRVPELVELLTAHLIDARNKYGVQMEEVRRLSREAEALEKERTRLAARVRELEHAIAAKQGAPDGGRRGRLRILMVVHDFLPRHRGGTEIYAWRLARTLASRHDVHLFFTEAHPGVASYVVREGEYDGLPFTEVSHQHVAATFEESWRDPMMESRFSAVLDRVRPDVVHIHHLAYLSLGTIEVSRAAGVPVVFTLHDYALLCPRGGRMVRPDLERCERPVPERCAECLGGMPIRPRRNDEDSLLASVLPDAVWRLLAMAAPRARTPRPETQEDRRAAVSERLDAVREALAAVDLVISPSAWLRKTFVDSGFADPARIVVSENGQDAAPFRAAARRGARSLRVGYVGGLVREKGIHVLVEALNLLADIPDLEASIHGFTDADAAYVRELETANENPRVTFAGPFSPDDIGKILASLDVLVVPSLWWENSPLTIQEAFLAGVPPVVSGIGGMAEKVIDGVNGLHFPPGDARALAAKLRALHADRTLLLRLGASRPLVKTIAEDAQDLELRYRDLVDAAAAR